MFGIQKLFIPGNLFWKNRMVFKWSQSCSSKSCLRFFFLQFALVGESLCCHNVCMVVGQSGGGQFIIHSLTFRLDWTLGPPQVSTPTHNHYIGGVEDLKVVFDSPGISHEIDGAASQSLKLMWNCWAEVLQTSKSRFVLSPRTLYDYMYIIEITCRRITGKKKIKTLSLFQTKKEDFGGKSFLEGEMEIFALSIFQQKNGEK